MAFPEGVPIYDLIDQPYRGDTFLLTIVTGYPTPDPLNPGEYLKDVNGNLVIDEDNLPDYTGFSMRFQVRPDPNAKRVYVDVNSTDGDIYWLDNVIYVTVPSVMMRNLPPIMCFYDLETTDSNGFVKTYMRGKFNINADVSKPSA